MDEQKVKLVLAGGEPLTLEHFVEMFPQLTGREPDPEDLKKAAERLRKACGGEKTSPT